MLNIQKKVKIEKEFLKIFNRKWYTEEDIKVNLYESITIYTRLKYSPAFMELLESNVINIKESKLFLSNFELYYERNITKNLQEVMEKELENRENLSFKINKNIECKINIGRVINILPQITHLLYEKYRRKYIQTTQF